MAIIADASADTFPKLLIRNAAKYAARPAIRHKDLGIWQTWTWAQVLDEVRDFSVGLDALGLTRGDKLAIIGNNRPRLYWAMAAAQGHVAMIEALLGAGAEIDARDARGNTALIEAVNAGATEAAERLIDRGASIDANNAAGDSAVTLAAREATAEELRVLIRAAAGRRESLGGEQA